MLCLLAPAVLADCSGPPDATDAPCAGGYCRINPLPPIDTLRKVWGSAPTDVWAVGDRGAIVHWDGSSWRKSPSGTPRWLTAVFGRSRTEVWAAGEDGTLLRGDGSTWQPVDSGTTEWIADLWGSAGDDLWAVDVKGGITHYDGASWQLVARNGDDGYKALWGSSRTDVWVAGGCADHGSCLRHFDGQSWTPYPLPGIPLTELDALWGRGPADVWAAGTAGAAGAGVLLHFDGTGWRDTLTGAGSAPAAQAVHAVAGNGSQTWALARTAGPHPTTAVLSWNGSAWAADPTTSARGPDLTALWQDPGGDLWAVGEQASLLQRSGGAWRALWDAARTLTAIWGASSGEVYVAGEAGALLRWDGRVWSALPTGTASPLRGVWGSASYDVWAVGDAGTLVHWDGSQAAVSAAPSAVPLAAVWGAGAADLWAGGDGGALLHYDGTGWAAAPAVTALPIRGLWGSASYDVWAVAGQTAAAGGSSAGAIARWNGAAWRLVSSDELHYAGPLPALSAIAGRDAADVWMVSAQTVWHWDGGALTPLLRSGEVPPSAPTDTPPTFVGTWGSSSADYYLTTAEGQIIHAQGAAAQRHTPPAFAAPLSALWGDGVGQLWAAGAAGTLLCGRADGNPCGAGATGP
jgi:hypothetical protein